MCGPDFAKEVFVHLNEGEANEACYYVNVSVYYGSPGTRDDPPESDEYNIVDVWRSDPEGKTRIPVCINAMPDEEFERIEAWVFDNPEKFIED